MILYVDGRELRQIIVGCEDDGMRRTFETEPEGFLAAIQTFLTDRGQTLDDVTQIVAERGPGSATALRSSLAIVNTLAWSRGFAHDHLYPIYDHAPNITKPKRDRLKRPLTS